jgi:hypothetical protein
MTALLSAFLSELVPVCEAVLRRLSHEPVIDGEEERYRSIQVSSSMLFAPRLPRYS